MASSARRSRASRETPAWSARAVERLDAAGRVREQHLRRVEALGVGGESLGGERVAERAERAEEGRAAGHEGAGDAAGEHPRAHAARGEDRRVLDERHAVAHLRPDAIASASLVAGGRPAVAPVGVSTTSYPAKKYAKKKKFPAPHVAGLSEPWTAFSPTFAP